MIAILEWPTGIFKFVIKIDCHYHGQKNYMLPIILVYLSIGLFIQSLIAFVEVCINFRRPILLKIIILIIAAAFAWRGIGYVYCYHYSYNRWAIEIPQSVLPFATISLFTYIYKSRLTWYFIAIGSLILVFQLFFQTYFSLTDPVFNNSPLWALPGAGIYFKIAKTIITFFVFSINLWILMKILTKYKPGNIYFIQLRRWTLYLLLFQLLSGISFVAYVFLDPGYKNIAYLFVLIFNYSGVLLLLFRPKFLNRSNLKIKLGNLFDKKVEDSLTEKLFIEVFFTHVFYLNQDASVETLKKQLNVSSEILNNFLYTHYGLALTDLVNKHRVGYFMDLVNTGKYGNYTIDALAQEAGFGSRFHLYKSFKKFHGGTPSDFIRSVHE